MTFPCTTCGAAMRHTGSGNHACICGAVYELSTPVFFLIDDTLTALDASDPDGWDGFAAHVLEVCADRHPVSEVGEPRDLLDAIDLSAVTPRDVVAWAIARDEAADFAETHDQEAAA